jgi:hypothetical protein
MNMKRKRRSLKEVYNFDGMDQPKRLTAKGLRDLINEEMSLLREQGEEEKETKTSGGGLVDINDGPDAVLAAVPKLVDDPELKGVLKSGLGDGSTEDEQFSIVGDSVPASALSPTQSQIGTGQSLDDQAGDKWGNLDRAIKGGKLASAAGEFPILVFGNKILDGHHRWSQFITTNPNATVDVARIQAPGITDEDGALGLAHFINFALYGKSPTKAFKGENVYGMDKDAIYQQAMDNMADTTPGKLKAAGLIDEETPEAAAEHFASNLSSISGPGTHPRTSMPQSADAGDPTGLTQTPDQGAAGKINYLEPNKSDIQEESVKSGDSLVMERWRRLAGVI